MQMSTETRNHYPPFRVARNYLKLTKMGRVVVQWAVLIFTAVIHFYRFPKGEEKSTVGIRGNSRGGWPPTFCQLFSWRFSYT